MNRRELLAAAPVLAAGLLAPTSAIASPDTPIMRLFRQHREMSVAADAWQAPLGMDPWEADREWDELFILPMDAVRDELLALPCVGPGDFAAKILLCSSDGDLLTWLAGDDLAAEARGLVG